MENTIPTQPYIFWADDDIDDLEIFRELLKELAPDHKLVQFENGQALLDHLNGIPLHHLPCLIVLDINMPVLNGRDTLLLLKRQQRFSSVPVVMFTTSNSSLDKAFCEEHDVSMITKPPNYDQLKAVVSGLITLCH